MKLKRLSLSMAHLYLYYLALNLLVLFLVRKLQLSKLKTPGLFYRYRQAPLQDHFMQLLEDFRYYCTLTLCIVPSIQQDTYHIVLVTYYIPTSLFIRNVVAFDHYIDLVHRRLLFGEGLSKLEGSFRYLSQLHSPLRNLLGICLYPLCSSSPFLSCCID